MEGSRREVGWRVGLAACIALLGLAVSSDSTRRPAAQRDLARLMPFDGGPSLTLRFFPKELTSDSRDFYRLELQAGDYIELAIDHQGIDAAASLFSPNGNLLTEVAYREQGPIFLLSIAVNSGPHVVEIRSLDRLQTRGRYSITVKDRHPADASDAERIKAYRSFLEAEALRTNWQVDSASSILEKYQSALDHWRAAADRIGQARAAARLGEVFRNLGRPEEALRELLESLRLNNGMDAAEECTALNAIARVKLDLGRTNDAYGDARRAREVSLANHNGPCEADALNALGEIAALSGRSRDSLGLYQRALEISTSLSDRRARARSLLNLGDAHADLMQIDDAERSYDSALTLWRDTSDRRGEAESLRGLGQLLGMVGEHQRALARYQQAKTIFEQIGDRVGLASVLSSTGIRHARLGDIETAVDYLAKGASLFSEVKLQNGEAAARLNLAMCLALLGRHSEALEEYAKASAISRTISDARLEARALQGVGKVYVELNQYDKAFAQYEQSRLLAQRVGDPQGELYALNGLGELMHHRGIFDQALRYFDSALRVADDSKYRFIKSLVLYNVARSESAVGHLETALERIRASIDLVEGLRTTVASLDLRASYLASVRDRYELEVDLLMRLDVLNPERKYGLLAFEASERARARAFLDGLSEARSDIREGASPELLSRERSARLSLNAAAQKLANIPTDSGHANEIAALTAEIAAQSAAYKDLDGQIRAESPRYASLVQPQPLTLAQVQHLIADHGTILLQYFVGSEHSYVWAVSQNWITVRALPSRSEIERRVRPYLSALAVPNRSQTPSSNASHERSVGGIKTTTDHSKIEGLARDVSEMLLGPIAPHLESPRLLVVADGILHNLPFAPLPDPRSRGTKDAPRLLIADHEIVNLPSISTLALLRGDWNQQRHWQKAAIVFADPVYERDDPRLTIGTANIQSAPGAADTRTIGGTRVTRLVRTRREAREIASLASSVDVELDFDANRVAATTSNLTNYKIIHFAAHGIVDNQHPELSGIVLSMYDKRGKAQDGFLRLHDIYNLKIPADLVVLSACSTALGKAVVGEGLIGLVRGFMYAGTRRVVASLWEVDDEATSELMMRFYRAMFEQKLPPPAALRAAQLEMLRTTRWKHPLYWAAFVLQGDWN